MWTGAEILIKQTEDDIHTLTIKLLNNYSSNQLLEAVLPNHQIISLNEIIPSMNDIFIMKVNQGNESEVLKDNETK